MIQFKDITIKYKLSVIIMLITFIALFIACVSYIIIDSINFRQKLYNDLITIADILAENNTANVLFSSEQDAIHSLNSLKANNNILNACIYDKNNEIFASYSRDTIKKNIWPKVFSYSVSGSLKEENIEHDKLMVFRPIVLNNEELGSIYIVSDLEELKSRTFYFIVIGIILLIVSILIAYFLSLRFQRVISDPILKLAKVEKEITENNDYSIRIQEDRKDEIGSTIRAFNEMLEQIERQKDELVSAKDLAIESEKTKEIFLANMSHEIRTPLNAIIGLTELLNQTSISDEQKKFIQGINSSGGQLMAIVNDILDFSKIQSGKFTLEKIPFKVVSVVEEVIHSLIFKVEEKKLSIQFNHDEKIPNILLGDPFRLKQILINLMNNAIKFTPKGSIIVNTLYVGTELGEAVIKFEIKDSGIGIPADKLDKIFDSFTQADSKTSRIYGGTGLGLAICKNLVELQSGKINVLSKEGEGSNFFFTIPYMVAKEQEIELDKNIHQNIQFVNTQILCVDDYPLNQILLNSVLEKMNIKVDLASNGIEAVEKIKNKKYDLIFMDIQMPLMDGMEATREIRILTDSDKKNTPIIALTANAINGEQVKFLSAGMNGYVLKPFKQIEIFEVLKKYLPHKINTTKEDKKLEKHESDTQGIINLTSLQEMTGGDEELVKIMLNQYLVEWPEFMEEINNSMQTNNIENIKRTVHKIKPSLVYVGLNKSYEKLEVLELDLYKNILNKEGINEVLKDMSEIIPKIKKYVSQ